MLNSQNRITKPLNNEYLLHFNSTVWDTGVEETKSKENHVTKIWQNRIT